MSFILKTNNRKSRSGSTIRAKIVSEDKKDYVFKDYPVVVLVENLSDKDRVLRDKQIVESVLDAANNWLYLTDYIKELAGVTEKYGSNEAYIGAPRISNGDAYMNSSGVVTKRPIYDPDVLSTEHIARLQIDVSCGRVSETIEREIHIPAYSADEVLATLRTNFTGDSLWNAVKKNNQRPEYIFSNFNNPTTRVEETINAYNQANPKIKLADIVNTSNSNAVPVLTIVYPEFDNITTIDNSNKVNYNLLTATEAKALLTTFDGGPVTDRDLTDAEKVLLTGIQNAGSFKTYGNTVAYKYFKSGQSAARATFSLGEASPYIITKELQFMSQLITAAEIKSIVDNSAYTSWILPFTYFELFNDDLSSIITPNVDYHPTSLKGSSVAAPKVILVKPGYNVVLKVPKLMRQLSTVAASTSFNDYLQDSQTEPIGYYQDADGLKGYADDMAVFQIEELENHELYIATSEPSMEDTTLSGGSIKNKTCSSENASGVQYFWIPSDEFDSLGGQLTFSFSITFKESITFNADNRQCTYYFTVQRGSAT